VAISILNCLEVQELTIQLNRHPQFSIITSFKMPRGAEYDNGIPQSDNAIEAGETKAHGVGNDVSLPKVYHHANTVLLTGIPQNAPLNHTQKVAPMPEETGSHRDVHPGYTGIPHNPEGSGKGGHEPKTLGENKGLGSQPGV
jgi:hypothetical protein